MAKDDSSTAKYLGGDKLFQQRARAVLPLLVRQASHRATIHYSELATELGMPNERNLNYVLGYVGEALKALSRDWAEEIPPVQCLVINKRDRMPGEGIGWFIKNRAAFRKLPRKEQRRRLQVELEKVFIYAKWLSVLSAFGLSPAESDYSHVVAKAKALGATRESAGGPGLRGEKQVPPP